MWEMWRRGSLRRIGYVKNFGCFFTFRVDWSINARLFFSFLKWTTLSTTTSRSRALKLLHLVVGCCTCCALTLDFRFDNNCLLSIAYYVCLCVSWIVCVCVYGFPWEPVCVFYCLLRFMAIRFTLLYIAKKVLCIFRNSASGDCLSSVLAKRLLSRLTFGIILNALVFFSV